MRNWIRFAAAHRPVIIRSVGIALTYGNIRLSPTYSHQLSPGHKRVGDLDPQTPHRARITWRAISGNGLRYRAASCWVKWVQRGPSRYRWRTGLTRRAGRSCRLRTFSVCSPERLVSSSLGSSALTPVHLEPAIDRETLARDNRHPPRQDRAPAGRSPTVPPAGSMGCSAHALIIAGF